MILCTTVAMGLAYLAILQAREERAICDRSLTATIRTCTRYHHSPDAPAYHHRHPDHHPRHYTRP